MTTVGMPHNTIGKEIEVLESIVAFATANKVEQMNTHLEIRIGVSLGI
jgi:hypothetical protein